MKFYFRFLENITEKEENNGIKLILIKIACLIFLLAMAICFSFMPYFISSCRKNNKFLSLSNSFSAGIFLSMGLIHILPESAEMLKELTDIPLAYILCFLSYALILFIEKIPFNSHALLHSGHSHRNYHIYERDDDIQHQSSEDELKVKEEYIETNKNKEDEKSEQIFNIKINQIQENPAMRNDHKNSIDNLKQIEKNIERNNYNVEKGGLTAYFLLLALGFHGLFEGISLGIQPNIRGTLFLFLAISLHKWAASLSLGISFVKSRVKRKQFIIMVLIFAFISPVGIVFGMILSSLASDILAGIFLSISVGTFIYIACSEIIIDEFSSSEYKYSKFLFFLLGAAIVITLSIVEIFSDAGHGHEYIN